MHWKFVMSYRYRREHSCSKNKTPPSVTMTPDSKHPQQYLKNDMSALTPRSTTLNSNSDVNTQRTETVCKNEKKNSVARRPDSLTFRREMFCGNRERLFQTVEYHSWKPNIHSDFRVTLQLTEGKLRSEIYSLATKSAAIIWDSTHLYAHYYYFLSFSVFLSLSERVLRTFLTNYTSTFRYMNLSMRFSWLSICGTWISF